MLKSLAVGLALAVSCLIASHVQAQTIGTSAGYAPGYSYLMPSQIFVGQRFITPGNGLTLQQFSMAVSTDSTSTVIVPRIYEVTSGGATATGYAFTTTTVWTGNNLTVNSTVPLKIDFDVPEGLSLDSTKVYALGVTYVSGDDAKVHAANIFDDYSQGGPLHLVSGNWNGNGGDIYFSASFATPVPTLSEWAMILLAGCLAIGAGLVIYRRRSLTA